MSLDEKMRVEVRNSLRELNRYAWKALLKDLYQRGYLCQEALEDAALWGSDDGEATRGKVMATVVPAPTVLDSVMAPP